MNKRRRFVVFFASAGLMSVFIFFTLSYRQDKPLNKWIEWLPGNRVESMITEIDLADGKKLNKRITIEDNLQCDLDCYSITLLEISQSFKDLDVYFSHDLTLPREKIKQYVVSSEVNLQEYFFVVEVYPGYSNITKIGINEDFNNSGCNCEN